MSAYENVVGGKLKLKGKPLDVKNGGFLKKKRKHKKYPSSGHLFHSTGLQESRDQVDKETAKSGGDDHLTPAERRYLQQMEKLELQRLAKMASKSHRDRIHEFNKYLANLSEHYDIPKVGPG